MEFEAAWLRYVDWNREETQDYFGQISVGEGLAEAVLERCVEELSMAASEALSLTPVVTREQPKQGIFLTKDASLANEEFWLTEANGVLTVSGGSEVGVLYGVFSLLRRITCGETIKGLAVREAPDNPLRMLNHWDNMDGSIERGYSGHSFFFADNRVITDARIRAYARLAASVGINGVVLNNVNVRAAATWLITDRYLDDVKAIADVFASYGIRLFLSVNFAAPMEIGGLSTADPLDADVCAWWEERAKLLYAALPGFGGFLVKADSEGRPGPFTYGRTHADGANMLAKALAPYGGLVIWRCFVYNCTQNWRDTKTDRARAGYDNFKPLDGLFADNVILQIKNGPMDFQVREPVSPLFGGLTKTNQMLEVQAAQEYTGQQKHVCYLIPMWKEVLSFATGCLGEGAGGDTVADIVSGRCFSQKNCGMAAVANTGNDANWTGHDFAAANWYGFGRLAWQTSLSAEEIANEWIRMTFGADEAVGLAVRAILLSSWTVYEQYTSPLGIGWMVNPNHHYGPNVEGYEYDRWGTYHRATCKAIGVDRTPAGTGYTEQYYPDNAKRFANVETCPEELLLFFHRIPYTYRLKDGRSLLQYIYDTHFEGVTGVEAMIMHWTTCKERVDTLRYERVLARLYEQLESAKEWRDRINTYFYRMTEIADEKGRTIYE